MIETPQILTMTAQPIACIHVVIPRSEIQKVMGPTVQELFGAVAAQGIKPSGPWFTHHLRTPSDVFDFEVCIPVPTPIMAAGRMQPGSWPAMRVVRTVYQGPYEGLGDAWGKFQQWIGSNGLKTGVDLWEVYLAGPESGADPSKWLTQLNRQVIS